MRDREGFPLHQTDAASAGESQLEPEVDPAASGADGDGAQPHGVGSSGDIGM